MNIVFVYQYFGTSKGSWSTRIYEISKKWIANNHSVTVITSPYEKSDIKASKFIEKQVVDGINLIVINTADSNRNSIIKRVFNALTFSLLSTYYSLRLKYDVLISSSGPITVGIPMIAARRLRRKPTFFEVRDLWPEGGIEMGIISKPWQIKATRWFEKQCYSHAEGIITSSPGQARFILKRYPKLKVEVIPNASDIELFGSLSNDPLPDWTRDKKIFTHIGSLGFIHNVQYWLNVALELKSLNSADNLLIVLIGDGAERDLLEKFKRVNNLDNVIFLGLMPKSDLPVWVQNSVATLFATLDNPVQDTSSPNKVFDSFAAAKPIIQSTKGWIRDLISTEECGLNVDVNNPKDAATKMRDLASDKEMQKRLGENAFRLASNEFNRDYLANKYLEFINA